MKNREQPTVTSTPSGMKIILVPNADNSLAINMRTLAGGKFVTSRIGYAKNPTPEHADAMLASNTPAPVVAAIRSALAQRVGSEIEGGTGDGG